MQLCSFSFNLTYLGQTWGCELCLESSRSWNRSPSLGIIGLPGWRMFVVKVTIVITKPSRDKCEKGSMWEIRQPLTAWEVPCFHLMLSSLCWCSNATKPHPALDSCGRNLSSESKSSPIVRNMPMHSLRTSFSLSQSLPSGSFHKPLILPHLRTDRLKTTIREN